MWEKNWNGEGKNRNETQTHHHCLLHKTHEQAIAAVGSNPPRQLREGEPCHWQNNNLIDNAAVRIIGNSGEKKKERGKLTVAAFSMQIASGEWWWRDLIPIVDWGLGQAETVPINIPLLLSWGGGTENATSAFTHMVPYLYHTILGNLISCIICVAMQKFWFTPTNSGVTS
jgi:hypothetical protein